MNRVPNKKPNRRVKEDDASLISSALGCVNESTLSQSITSRVVHTQCGAESTNRGSQVFYVFFILILWY